jgi:hypothetical protein
MTAIGVCDQVDSNRRVKGDTDENLGLVLAVITMLLEMVMLEGVPEPLP